MKMLKKWKRTLASLMSVAMLVSVVSTGAYAVEEENLDVEPLEEVLDVEPLAETFDEESLAEELFEAEPAAAVASLGGETFETLQAALDAAVESGGEVVLLENVTEDVRFTAGAATLNLSDYTLTGSVTNEAGANLTITADADGGIQSQNGGNAVTNWGTMTINGGAYSMVVSGKFGQTIDNEGEGTLTIVEADVTASGGERAYAVYSAGSMLTIEDGTYRSSGATYGRTVYISMASSAYISGGTIEGSECGVYVNSTNNVTISGGNIIGADRAVTLMEGRGPVTITGGTFSSDVSEYVEGDRLLIETDDGYVVESGTVSISLDRRELTLQLGGESTARLTAEVTPENARITWTSSDPAVATVENGLVTAVGAGRATVTAAVGNAQATCLVTVNEREPDPVPVRVSLDKTTLALYVGDNETLAAQVEPEGSTVTWSSSDDSVATVENGVVTALRAGTATIKAEVGEESALCTVTVTTRGGNTGGGSTGGGSTGGGSTGGGSTGGGSTGGGSTGGGSTGGSGSGGGTTVTQPPQEEELLDEETPLTEKPFLFKDVATRAWYYEAVKYVYNADMMGAMNRAGDIFGPTNPTTRGMVVTILWRLEGEPGAPSAGFTDAPDNQWYSTAVAWGVTSGIVKGYNKTTFGPNNNVTREELAVILYRYAQMKGYDVSARHDLGRFSDSAQVHTWATDAMEWAVATGLIQGSGGQLNPRGGAVRCEVAQLLMRFCKTFPVKGGAQ